MSGSSMTTTSVSSFAAPSAAARGGTVRQGGAGWRWGKAGWVYASARGGQESGPGRLQRSDQGVVRCCLRRADAGAGAGLGVDRQRRERAGDRAHRVGQDAGRVPMGDRQAGHGAGPGGSAAALPGALHLAAEGPRGGHRAQPALAADRRRPRPAPPTKRRMELKIVVPAEDMADLEPAGGSTVPGTEPRSAGGQPGPRPEGPAGADGEPPPDDAVRRRSIWPHVEERVLDEIQSHRSTIVFANSRRLAERLCARLNELAAERAEEHDGTPPSPVPGRAPVHSPAEMMALAGAACWSAAAVR